MMSAKIDTSAIDAEFKRLEGELGSTLRKRLTKVGERAVEVAKETGTYHDVTGRLRRSNKFKVDADGLVIYNDAPYAEEVEARGEIVLTTAVLEAQKMLDEYGDDE